MFVDSHCHLDCLVDPEKALQRARNVGVTTFLTIGVHHDDLEKRLLLIQEETDVFFSIGVHPCYVAQCPLSPAELYDSFYEKAQHPRVIGIGETGFDLGPESPDLALQSSYFWSQMRLALALDLPVIIHMRYAEKEIEDLFASFQAEFGSLPKHIFHCFTGTPLFAKRAVARGGLISFSGILTFPNAIQVQDVAKEISLISSCIESDAPWLTPVPHRGKKNEPAYVIETAKKLAEIKSVSLEELAQQTTANFFKLFDKAVCS